MFDIMSNLMNLKHKEAGKNMTKANKKQCAYATFVYF